MPPPAPFFLSEYHTDERVNEMGASSEFSEGICFLNNGAVELERGAQETSFLGIYRKDHEIFTWEDINVFFDQPLPDQLWFYFPPTLHPTFIIVSHLWSQLFLTRSSSSTTSSLGYTTMTVLPPY